MIFIIDDANFAVIWNPIRLFLFPHEYSFTWMGENYNVCVFFCCCAESRCCRKRLSFGNKQKKNKNFDVYSGSGRDNRKKYICIACDVNRVYHNTRHTARTHVSQPQAHTQTTRQQWKSEITIFRSPYIRHTFGNRQIHNGILLKKNNIFTYKDSTVLLCWFERHELNGTCINSNNDNIYKTMYTKSIPYLTFD